MNSVLKTLGLSAAALMVVSFSGQALADIRVFAAGGVTGQTPEAGSTPSTKTLTGVEGKLAAHIDVFSPVPGVSVYAGPELRSGTSIREYDDAAVLKVKETVKSSSAGLEAGVHVGLIPVVTLQGGLNYGFPMGGSKEVVKATGTITGKATKGTELGATLRAMITPFPMFRLGAEYGFTVSPASTTYENHGEVKYNAWAGRVVLGISL